MLQAMAKHMLLQLLLPLMQQQLSDHPYASCAILGIAGGNGVGLIFAKGEIIKKVPEEELIDALMEEIEKL